MKPDQTKAFRFPVKAGGRDHEIWVVIFMDDIDAPDLAIHAGSDVIQRFEKLSPEP
jgi:hypothetical protein